MLIICRFLSRTWRSSALMCWSTAIVWTRPCPAPVSFCALTSGFASTNTFYPALTRFWQHLFTSSASELDVSVIICNIVNFKILQKILKEKLKKKTFSFTYTFNSLPQRNYFFRWQRIARHLHRRTQAMEFILRLLLRHQRLIRPTPRWTTREASAMDSNTFLTGGVLLFKGFLFTWCYLGCGHNFACVHVSCPGNQFIQTNDRLGCCLCRTSVMKVMNRVDFDAGHVSWKWCCRSSYMMTWWACGVVYSP